MSHLCNDVLIYVTFCSVSFVPRVEFFELERFTMVTPLHSACDDSPTNHKVTGCRANGALASGPFGRVVSGSGEDQPGALVLLNGCPRDLHISVLK